MSADGRPSARRRLFVVSAYVLIPITLGAVATVILYATRPAPPPAAPISTAVPAASDTEITDGSILILQPETTNQVKIPLGQEFEIVLQTGPGQAVVSDTPGILVPVTPNPPCHIFSLCGTPGTDAWTFHAAQKGVGYLKISFGRHCSLTTGACDSIHIVLLKPFAVYGRPQAQ
ncbi:MAG: hypothetical protein WCB51_07160 [Candidatus Dormiibacterota bacterium]